MRHRVQRHDHKHIDGIRHGDSFVPNPPMFEFAAGPRQTETREDSRRMSNREGKGGIYLPRIGRPGDGCGLLGWQSFHLPRTCAQFGPVIPIIKYRTVEEAIPRANAVEVGLGGSVWGDDPKLAAKYAQQLECGTAWVNQHGALHPLAPFGGIKCSGLGVENNVEGLHEYTTLQVLSVAH